MTGRRAAAAGALAVGAATVAWAVFLLVRRWPIDVLGPFLLLLAVPVAWWAVRRRGARRALGLAAAVALVLVSLLELVQNAVVLEDAVTIAGALVAVLLARHAFTIRVPLPRVPPPAAPVLFVNPWSGDGRAERTGLVPAARERGLEVVVLQRGDDLADLVEAAVARGADGLAMAGGDGSQAIVARIASAHGLAYACIPSGTRNHFALDLGVDRDDDLGALDAFGPGAGEHVVDLAEVNGRTFVNNVSLGVYAEAVQREGYRARKLRTILDTVPDVVGPDGEALDLEWTSPSGTVHRTAAVILVSNNRYRLGRLIGSGTRPRIDDGLLGVAVVAGRTAPRGLLRRPWRDWSTPAFDVRSAAPVSAGIDGETVLLDPPLRFTIRPGVLRARIAPQHPGASPSAGAPSGALAAIAALARIAGGRPAFSRSRPGSSGTG
jgi:diacylglycerol kinase family enzyme